MSNGNSPHRRFNPLKNEWVLVSPQRNLRPWLGQIEKVDSNAKPAHDPECFLCAGNKRIGGQVNPNYRGPHVFQNDFPALLPDIPLGESSENPLFSTSPVRGEARVICYSERHDLTMPQMPVSTIAKIVDMWIQQSGELSSKYDWVAIFENKGQVMGCSNPHPHGQIWASDFLPNEIVCEDQAQQDFYSKYGRALLLDYVTTEYDLGERVVVQNRSWLAVVPFWATWPFEILLLPRRHVKQIVELNSTEKRDLAKILKSLTVRYDNLFGTEFPYSMGWHGAPNTSDPSEHWQLHAHFYPPLLRSATVRKFMVGYELLAEPQRDLTPEKAAAILRDLTEIHYL